MLTFLDLSFLRFALDEDLEFALFAIGKAIDVLGVDIDLSVVHGDGNGDEMYERWT